MLLNQKAIHRSMIAAATHEYINALHIESQNHCTAVVFAPIFYIVRDKTERLCRGSCLLMLFFFFFFFNILFPGAHSPTLKTLSCSSGEVVLNRNWWRKQRFEKRTLGVSKNAKKQLKRDANAHRKDLRIGLSMTRRWELFVVCYSLPPLPILPHFQPHNLLRLSHLLLLRATGPCFFCWLLSVPTSSPLIRPDGKQTPSFSGPVIHFLCFLPFHFPQLFCSVSLSLNPHQIHKHTICLCWPLQVDTMFVFVCVGGGILCLHTSLFMFDLSAWERNCDMLLMP